MNRAPSPFGAQNGIIQASPFGPMSHSSNSTSNPFSLSLPSTTNPNPFSGSAAAPTTSANPFATAQVRGEISMLGQAATATAGNPFANVSPLSTFNSSNPFAGSTSVPKPAVGSPSTGIDSKYQFGTSQMGGSSGGTSIFGASTEQSSENSTAITNGFRSASPTPTRAVGSSTNHTVTQPTAPKELNSIFGASNKPATTSKSSIKSSFAPNGKVKFGASSSAPRVSSPLTNSFRPQSQSVATSTTFQPQKSQLATEIDMILRKKNLFPPPWPTDSPGDPAKKTVMESFWQNMKAYRAKVRDALIASGKIDDPNKPKRLEDAIDFKGTCEEMCPQFEKITRIVEHDVQGPEKELAPDGKTLWPSARKMVKALARSAAGQDAPLPDDIRSPRALRRTVDYLIGDVLASSELSTVHGFLWDRTRAIRRDFVFLQASMTAEELKDQVYCLETITRFHAVALHQMVRSGTVVEGFSQQQEIEQLGKALLSLIQAYEDCGLLDLECENEAEFRAYYVLFNSHNPAIVETVQNWSFKFWGQSQLVKTAVHLVECLQNVWDDRGPLRPHTPAIAASNGYSRFFAILKDHKVSYIMACFAEIHFNEVRKAYLNTILASSRNPKLDKSQWWPTLEELNRYLYFDNEEDIVTFGEAYNLQFQDRNGDICLNIWGSPTTMEDPFPPVKQRHSLNVVESKRGNHSLPELIQKTVYPQKSTKPLNSASVPKARETPKQDLSSTGPSTLQAQQKMSEQPQNPFLHSNDNTAKTLLRESLHSLPPATSESFTFSQPASKSVSLSAPQSKAPAVETKSAQQDPKPSSLFSFLDNANTALEGNMATTSSLPLKNAVPDSTEDVSSMATSVMPTTSSAGSNTTVLKQFELPPFISAPRMTNHASLTNTTSKLAAHTQDAIPPAHSPSQTVKLDSRASQPRIEGVSPVANEPLRDHIGGFNAWVVEGEGGIIDQYTQNQVKQILAEVWDEFKAAERDRLEKEEYERTEAQIAAFRTRNLAVKYAYKWRLNAQRSWLKRQGRQDRENRRRFAEQHSKHTDSIVDDFKASVSRTSAKQISLTERESTSSSSATSQENTGSKRQHRTGPTSQPTSSRVIAAESSISFGRSSEQGGHRRHQSESTMMGSRMVDRMSVRDIMVQGCHHTSRIDLIPNYDPEAHVARRTNGVSTPYFRLKARGIVTLPDGSPLASSAAIEFEPAEELQRKTSLDGIHKLAKTHPLKRSSRATTGESSGSQQEFGWRSSIGSRSWTPKKPTPPTFSQSVPVKPILRNDSAPKTYAEKKLEIEAIKTRARQSMLQQIEAEHPPTRKRLLDTSDEELFAKARKIREEMDMDERWFREQSRKISESPL